MLRCPMKELCAVVLAILTAAAGCATAIETVGGDGGEGGDDNSGGSGGGAMSLCEADCSLIAAPACYKGACNEATKQCEIVPDDGSACDDGQFCTVGETCSAGTCSGGSANPCSEIPSDGCSGAVCNEDQDMCLAQTLPDGTSCLLEDLCTVNATCKAGICSGSPKDCFFAPPPDECHTMACSPASGNCEPVPGNNGAACTDPNDLCTINKTCSGGMCQGGQPKCAGFGDLCSTGVCDLATGTCSSEMIPGSDGLMCDDGNACTDSDVCSSGVCAGTPTADYIVYFDESFSSNAAGWTLGQEWEIGPAKASAGFPTGFEDPALDHTASADNGIAGVVIGGYATEVVHPMYYLESPTFNADGANPVVLQFWRHLNSDYTPYMNNVVEVYNGVQWTTIWQSGNIGIEDSQWTFISHDITAYKSANMKIRFGFDIGSSGVFTVSSWNIDDVVVASKTCP